jgi:dipeptidase
VTYAQGADLANRMPLWVKPKAKLTREDVHRLMSLHYRDTFFSPYVDVGAGAEHSPYRWNGLEWSLGETKYVNERVVGVHYTAWHFVGQLRRGLPSQMSALLHWGADDHSWAPKIPLHGGASAVHPSYDDFNCTARDACRRAAGLPGTVTNFSFDSAWWLNQIVADQVYSRSDRAAPFVQAARAALEAKLDGALSAADEKAAAAFAAGDEAAALKVLDEHAVAAGAAATEAWKGVWQDLVVKFIDGRTTTLNPEDEVCGCTKTPAEFSDAWKASLLADPKTEAHYALPDGPVGGAAAHGRASRPKLTIKGVA